MSTLIASERFNELLRLRAAVLKDRNSMRYFEESPETFLEQNDIKVESERELISSLNATPKGLRCLTLDYAVSLHLNDYQFSATTSSDPQPRGPIPIPVVGVNVLAVYNAIVIGNVGAYHQALYGVAVYQAAVATTVAKYNGSGESDVASTTPHPLPACTLDDKYLNGSLHQALIKKCFGDSRERLYLREIIDGHLTKLNTPLGINVISVANRGHESVIFKLVDSGGIHVLEGIARDS